MATSQEANKPEKTRKAASNKAEAAPEAAETATGDQPVLERPAVLWKKMSDAQREAAAHAFWTDPQSQMEHIEINALMARRLNFRMKSVQTMAVDRKVKHLMAMGNVTDGVAGRLLVTYHLSSQRPMMGAFLDALDPNKTVWEEVSGGLDELEVGKKTVASRAYVSWFNFKGRDQQRKIGTLSGGERNRVHLAKLLRRGSNLLLLD